MRGVAREALLVAVLLAGGIALRGELVHRGWLYAGSDSYGYLKIADQWRHDGRIAFGPPPQPLEWYRRPAYPVFLALVRGDAIADMNGGPGWRRIIVWQIAIEMLLLCPLLYFTLRRVVGVGAALIGLALAALYPPGAVFSLAVLTESLAMLLALLAIAPLLWLTKKPSPWAWGVAGVGAALSALLRPDGVFCLVAVIPILFLRTIPWRARARGAAIFGLTFCVLFGPWPIRNLVRFGHAHLTDGMIDRLGNDIPNYRGFWDWMRSWSNDERAAGFAASCFYDPMCDPKIETYGSLDAFAGATDPERTIVEHLLDERKRVGITPAVSDAFEELARARRHAHPFQVLVELPLRRTMRAWWAPQTELVQYNVAWPAFFRRQVLHFKAWGHWLYVGVLLSMLLLAVTPGYR